MKVFSSKYGITLLLALFSFFACQDDAPTANVEDDDAWKAVLEASLEIGACATATHISVDSLPSPVSNYISQTFPNDEIDDAWQYDNGNFRIEMEDDIILLLDSQGNLLGQIETNLLSLDMIPDSLLLSISSGIESDDDMDDDDDDFQLKLDISASGDSIYLLSYDDDFSVEFNRQVEPVCYTDLDDDDQDDD